MDAGTEPALTIFFFPLSLCFPSGFLSRWAGLPGPWFRADLRVEVHLRRSSVAFYFRHISLFSGESNHLIRAI